MENTPEKSIDQQNITPEIKQENEKFISALEVAELTLGRDNTFSTFFKENADTISKKGIRLLIDINDLDRLGKTTRSEITEGGNIKYGSPYKMTARIRIKVERPNDMKPKRDEAFKKSDYPGRRFDTEYLGDEVFLNIQEQGGGMYNTEGVWKRFSKALKDDILAIS